MLEKISALRSRFPKVFWVVQSFELLERGAYYTMVPIIAIYAHFVVGVPYELALILTVFMYPIQYGLPIFSGAYAEKGGYRPQLILAFVILTIAYLFLSFAYDSYTMILAVILIGLGIGIYKPLISATVAKSTVQKDRTLAYSIYYLVVNIAAAMFPIIYVLLEFGGVVSAPGYYAWVFRFGAVFFMANVFIAAFVFKEIPRSGEVKTVGDVVNNIKVAFKDKKFLVMVILVGCFWALYSTFLNVLPMVLIGFNLVPLWFTAMVLAIFNPATIILLGPFLIKPSEKIESIKWLMGGVLVYSIGLSIIGLTLQWQLVVIGIIVASIGEFMVAPGYLAFVSKLAPKDKVSAYIGCNFLSTMLGITIGTLAFGLMASYIAIDLRMPNFTYGILISIALILLVAFIAYYRTWGQDIIDRARKIREVEEGIDEEEETYNEPIFFKIFDNKLSMIIPLLVIPIILFATFSLGTKVWYGVEEEAEVGPPLFKVENYDVIDGIPDDYSGTLLEGEATTRTISLELDKGEFLQEITFELTWQDEADIQLIRTWENQPDQYAFDVSLGGNLSKVDTGENPHGGEGSIVIRYEFDHDTIESTNGTGSWDIEIRLNSCGNYKSPNTSTEYPLDEDTSNNYFLAFTSKIYTPK